MREILFRGKRIDNGEWVEGYYSASPAGNHYITYVCVGCAHPDKVDPVTVGQQTGLKDIIRTSLFEGDILKFDYIGKNKGVNGIAYVSFFNGKFGVEWG